MPVWFLIAQLALALVIAVVFQPKVKSPKPASLQDSDVPTVEQGREVIDVCGTVWIKDQNVVWYGDLSTSPIRASSGK